jgi:hypothetical protein
MDPEWSQTRPGKGPEGPKGPRGLVDTVDAVGGVDPPAGGFFSHYFWVSVYRRRLPHG